MPDAAATLVSNQPLRDSTRLVKTGTPISLLPTTQTQLPPKPTLDRMWRMRAGALAARNIQRVFGHAAGGSLDARMHCLPAPDSGGRHWAIVATLLQTAKLNDVDPLAWLTDVLERIVAGLTKRNELGMAAAVELEGRKGLEAPSSA